ncbi:MAG: YaiI/YqxD family protein [Alphaproteobacteria bacterium]|nr:MAG: YaiI/YqxD family protein [Alphaproteobacteria bacterium]
MSEPQIYVDADACPVKDEAIRVAMRHRLTITLVANQGSRPTRDPMIRYVYVPYGPDAADDWIVEQVADNDIVITSDIPLAGRVLELGAQALAPTGKRFTRESIGMALAIRVLKQHLRETGEIRDSHPEFSARDRSQFLSALDEAVTRSKRQAQGAGG